MGVNAGGNLGDGTFNNTNRPEKIVASGVIAIAAGSCSLFLKSDGSLWAMGDNSNGELGDGTFNSTNRPEQIVASGVTAIAAGGGHNLFLKSDGSLWGMGLCYDGQLGDGTSESGTIYYTNRPEQIVASGVIAIAAGSGHSLFLKSDGSLWGMGYNRDGELGDGTFNDTNRPEQIVASGVTAIAAGDEHSLFLKSDGNLWGMGDNEDGQLGDGTYTTVNRPELILGPPPPLGIGTYSNAPVVFFPTILGTKHTLQMTTNLASGNWVTVTNGIPFSGVQITNAPGTAFFRLQ